MRPASELQQLAVECARLGDFGPKALDINRELAQVDPANQGAWTRLARCYLESGLLDEATAALDAVLQLNPQNTIARNLQGEVTRRRIGNTSASADRRAPSAVRRSRNGSRSPVSGQRTAVSGRRTADSGVAFGRAEFTALGQLPAAVAIEALGAKIESLLMALNERPFAAKAVETRNRAGLAGGWLFRRNSIYAGSDGHVFAFHHGGRWEPQMNIGLLASPQWGRDGLRAGIGFNMTAGGAEAEDEAGRERVLSYFTHFQQLVSSAWRNLLGGWMSANGGFIQYGASAPHTDRLPPDALDLIVGCQNPAEVGWIFVGRWLFADRAADAETLRDQRRLVAWTDDTFTALLPLWTSLYRA